MQFPGRGWVVHYYSYSIKDFRAGSVNMSRLERWIYRDLLDVYYDTEQPLTLDLDKLCREIGARAADERAAVSEVLDYKFEKTEAGYRHERCDLEIARCNAKSEVAKENGKKGAAGRYRDGEYMACGGTLYAVRFSPDWVKIGITSNMKSRLNQLRKKYGAQARIVHRVDVSHMGDAEADMLDAYAGTRSGEEIPVTASAELSLIEAMNRISFAYRSPEGSTPVASGSHPGRLLPNTHYPTPITQDQTNVKDTVELVLDGGSPVEKKRSEAENIEGIFAYWRKCMSSPKSKLDDKRKGVIRRALAAGYSPFDLCRAIRGCRLTPHNQGHNDRGQRYIGIQVCLKDADNIDRFIANSKLPPKAPEKKVSNEIPGWWNSPALALEQAKLVGVSNAHYGESLQTWHARIRAAIENGGKPPTSVAAAAPVTAPAEVPRVVLTPEQKEASRAALHAALKKKPVEEPAQ